MPGPEPVVFATESGKHPRQPDEGRSEFTKVPEVESLTRGSDTSSPTSARRESADYDVSRSTMPTSGADFQTRYAETQTNLSNLTNIKQSTPGPFQAARADITQTKDRQIDLGVDYVVQSTHLQSVVTDRSQFRKGRNTDGATSYLRKRHSDSFESYGSSSGVIVSNTVSAFYFFDATTAGASRFTA